MQNNTESLQKKDIVIFNHHTLSSVKKKRDLISYSQSKFAYCTLYIALTEFTQKLVVYHIRIFCLSLLKGHGNALGTRLMNYQLTVETRLMN